MSRFACLAFVISVNGFALSPQEIADGTFLGELYPSGNVYLKSFTRGPREVEIEAETLHKRTTEAKSSPAWSKTIVTSCLLSKGCIDKDFKGKKFEASFQREFDPSLSKKTLPGGDSLVVEAYIPSLEGMTDDHNQSCGLADKKNPAYSYADLSDFFDTVFDYCVGERGVGLYKTKSASKKALQVIAFSTALPVDKIETLEKPTSRPVEKTEKASIVAAKKKESSDDQCTTVSAYIDSAKVLAVASLKGGLKARVSTYENAGCAGHLGTVYVLDILDGAKVLKTAELSHYNGPI